MSKPQSTIVAMDNVTQVVEQPRRRGRPPKNKQLNASVTYVVANNASNGQAPVVSESAKINLVKKKLLDKSKVADSTLLADQVVKKSRGRPLKTTTTIENIDIENIEVEAKKTRGRPPKAKQVIDTLALPEELDHLIQAPVAKKRGRPSKAQQEQEAKRKAAIEKAKQEALLKQKAHLEEIRFKKKQEIIAQVSKKVAESNNSSDNKDNNLIGSVIFAEEAKPKKSKKLLKALLDSDDSDSDSNKEVDFDDFDEDFADDISDLFDSEDPESMIEGLEDEDVDVLTSKKLKPKEIVEDIKVEKVLVPFVDRFTVKESIHISQEDTEVTAKILAPLGIKPYQLTEKDYKTIHGELVLDYMNKPQRDHIERILTKTLEQLNEQLIETKDNLQETENYADDLDKASLEQEFALDLRNRDRERRLVHKIERTLSRLINDPYNFGYCSECGDEITLRRLEARPTAELCINCKGKSEVKESHRSKITDEE